MKVICIKEDTITVKGPELPSMLKVGNYYTVIDEFDYDNKLYYGVSGISNTAFLSTLFVPTSNIDETELAEQRLQTA